ncbi:MAG: TldD/PmbA family protein [Methanospirillum sp.]|nr:TldD/PmbA family protein [Methanospirillum sp.]
MARYFDVRHVSGEATNIDIDNGVVESATTSFFDRAVVRVLGPWGWGVVSVDNYRGADLDRFVAEALALAELTGEEVALADAPCRVLPVPPPSDDPRSLGLEEKTALLAAVESSARGAEVRNTRAVYTERQETVRFASSEGAEYAYALGRSGYSVLAVAERNGVVQMGFERRHAVNGFPLRTGMGDGEKARETALALLDARAATGGRMRVVLDPELAGVFAHEAVGHASEGDLVREGNSVLAGRIGERIGGPGLTIADDPSLPEFGFDPVDAEGVATGRTELVKDGVISAFLHTRETLAAVGDGQAGHARAMPGEAPLVRMSNTFIENGDANYDECLEECGTGMLLIGSRGGQVDPGRGMFQFNAEYGYLVEDGALGGMVRDVSLSGEILGTLHEIALIADDRRMHQGYCGKGGQSVPVGDGAPHVLLSNAVVGGSGRD